MKMSALLHPVLTEELVRTALAVSAVTALAQDLKVSLVITVSTKNTSEKGRACICMENIRHCTLLLRAGLSYFTCVKSTWWVSRYLDIQM